MIEIKATEVTYRNGAKVEKLLHSEAFEDNDFGETQEEIGNNLASFFANFTIQPSSDEKDACEPEAKNAEDYTCSDSPMKCAADAWMPLFSFSYIVDQHYKPVFGYDLIERELKNGKSIVGTNIEMFSNLIHGCSTYKVTVALR